MSGITVERYQATVAVRPGIGSDGYTARSIIDLERAVIAACRAINTDASQDLIARIVGEHKPPSAPAAAR